MKSVKMVGVTDVRRPAARRGGCSPSSSAPACWSPSSSAPGIAAQQLSPSDVGLQLLENSIATVFGLAVLILMLGPVSGAHFNPVVSLADWLLGRRTGAGLTLPRSARLHRSRRCAGGIGGALLANVDVRRRRSTSRPSTGPAAGTCSARSSRPPVLIG